MTAKDSSREDAQHELIFRSHENGEVSDEVLLKQPTKLDALILSKNYSGLNDKQIFMNLEIDQAQWSRIITGQANFPINKEIKFMEIVGNLILLRWTALKCGYKITALKSTLELELDNERIKNEELQKKLAYFEEWMARKNGR